jgi:membrane dipeptidase
MKCLAVCACLLLTACATCTETAEPTAAPPDASAPVSVHEKLLVLDAHLDTPAHFHDTDYTFSRRGSWEADETQVDLPRMREGGLDGGFWVIYHPQGPLEKSAYASALSAALMRQAAIREFAAKYSYDVELAFSADDAARIGSADKIVVLQSMENAYPLGEDVTLLRIFYTGGLRMVGPVHYLNNQFADAATDIRPQHDGLSPLGEELVLEANRLGMIIDGSHASVAAIRDMMAVSSTPIILSHSGAAGVYDHPRNAPDDLLLDIAADGGVIQVLAFTSYLQPPNPGPERKAAIAALEAEYGASFGPSFYTLSPEKQTDFRAAMAEIGRKYPEPRATFEVFMQHLLHVLALVGPDHVGIGADWDGGGGVAGLEDVSQIPKITQALLDAGYSDEDVAKIWSGNMLRLLAEAEAARTVEIASPGTMN